MLKRKLDSVEILQEPYKQTYRHLADKKKKKSKYESEETDPIPFPLPDNNMNACSDSGRVISFKASQTVNIMLPNENALSCHSLGTLFKNHVSQHKAPLLLVFHDSTPSEDGTQTHVEIINDLCNKYPNSIVCVSDKIPPNNRLNMTRIEDTHAYLAKELRALHPLGGGRAPLDCLVFIDSDLRQRGFVPITNKRRDALKDIADHTLQYLIWEQQR
ncbi:hypothetical protein TRVA0_014S00100 [Trichomonascus vanleenenianus]|uniref:uncharacterized protein n=1 Tax=Trichomonascus vanleenenianus TaxID=2268995 RepID=UPI003EC9D0E2